jgi:hypothetical protein
MAEKPVDQKQHAEMIREFVLLRHEVQQLRTLVCMRELYHLEQGDGPNVADTARLRADVEDRFVSGEDVMSMFLGLL